MDRTSSLISLRLLVAQKAIYKLRLSAVLAAQSMAVAAHREQAEKMAYLCSVIEGALYRSYRLASGMGL